MFVFVEVLIFLSGERTAFFNNTLAALFIIIMINNFKKIRIITLLTSFFLIVLISTYDDTAKNRVWDQTINQIGINSSKFNKGEGKIFSSEIVLEPKKIKKSNIIEMLFPSFIFF